jgi:hypothetical protein
VEAGIAWAIRYLAGDGQTGCSLRATLAEAISPRRSHNDGSPCDACCSAAVTPMSVRAIEPETTAVSTPFELLKRRASSASSGRGERV